VQCCSASKIRTPPRSPRHPGRNARQRRGLGHIDVTDAGLLRHQQDRNPYIHQRPPIEWGRDAAGWMCDQGEGRPAVVAETCLAVAVPGHLPYSMQGYTRSTCRCADTDASFFTLSRTPRWPSGYPGGRRCLPHHVTSRSGVTRIQGLSGDTAGASPVDAAASLSALRPRRRTWSM